GAGGYSTNQQLHAFPLTSTTPYTGPFYSMQGSPTPSCMTATPPTNYQYFTMSSTEEPPSTFAQGSVAAE
ncbi:MAG TPA: hypothetical protein VF997_17420, partial [Polyangia bacterium]